jgi:hypothetical protein
LHCDISGRLDVNFDYVTALWAHRD